MPLHDVQLLCFGAAAVIDTALLLVLFERRNWRRVAMPVVMLLLGAWLYHVGTFLHTLLLDTPGVSTSLVHAATMVIIAAGLLLMPSAMLHTLLRLNVNGFTVVDRIQKRNLVCYVPLLALPVAGILIADNPKGDFLSLVAPLVLPYIVWLVAVNGICAAGFIRMRRDTSLQGGRSFLAILAGLLILLAIVHSIVVLALMPRFPEHKEYWSLLVVLSPLTIVMLFAYYIFRYSFMQLVFERTVVYGAIVLGVVVAHRFVFRNFHEAWDQRFRFDFAFVETALVVTLILAYRPLRQRTAEGLRYFMGERFRQLRERVRQGALDMSSLAGRPPGEIIEWFERTSQEIFYVQYASVTLLGAATDVTNRDANNRPMSREAASALLNAMNSNDVVACTRYDAPTGDIDNTLRNLDISLVVALNQPGMCGLIVLGPQADNRLLSPEQINMVIMLVEQLGITLTMSRLQAERIAAERRALQHEKLSTIGLVTGSIAHEVKNPLSSIKTIASVLAEDLADTPHARDLELILGEVNRLSETVSQLLSFARPKPNDSQIASFSSAVVGTLQLMRHLATKQNVQLSHDVEQGLPGIHTNENVLREIAFNLISNAIDAAGEGGHVDVSLKENDGLAELIVGDDGAGISPDVQDRLFEPFVTGKPEGTGLGLYVVGRHVRELGGEIHCETEKTKGTRFIVRLPCNGKNA